MMHRFSIIYLFSFIFLQIAVETNAQHEYRKIENNAFQPGERLEWRFFYDSWLVGITAGYGIAEVKETDKTFNGREVYHIDTEGFSVGMFNWFFKVRDNFDSYIDKEAIAPHYFVRRTREGGYTKDDEYTFNHFENHVSTRKMDSIPTPPYVQDFISAVFYARTFNSDTLEIGDIIPVNFFLDDSVYNSAMRYEGKEVIKIKLGKFRCLKLKPGMATGEVFADKYPMTLWVTDDKNHVPVLAKSAVVVGNLKAELKSYEGLANPMTALIRED